MDERQGIINENMNTIEKENVILEQVAKITAWILILLELVLLIIVGVFLWA